MYFRFRATVLTFDVICHLNLRWVRSGSWFSSTKQDKLLLVVVLMLNNQLQVFVNLCHYWQIIICMINRSRLLLLPLVVAAPAAV